MVKFDDATARRLVMCAAYVAYEGVNFRDMWNVLFQEWHRDPNHRHQQRPETRQNMLDLLAREEPNRMAFMHEDVFMQDVERMSAALVNDGEEKPDDEKRLIDKLIDILMHPHAKQVLAGETLKRLRHALLLPTEMNGLTERLNAAEMSCAGCGRTIRAGEMTTQNRSGFYCKRCLTPSVVACSHEGCYEPVAIDSRLHGVLVKPRVCPMHEEKKGTEAQAPAPPPPPAPEPPNWAVAGIFDENAPLPNIALDPPDNRLREAARRLAQGQGQQAQWVPRRMPIRRER